MEKMKLIELRIWDILKTHQDDASIPLYWNKETQSLNYQDEGKPISDKDAKTLIRNWITKELKRLGKLYLYTCPDNSMITLETPQPNDEDLNTSEQETLLPQLFIFWD
jgi:hypothetical protein